MFQVREEDTGYCIREEICLPPLRQQDFLQAQNKSENSKGCLIIV